MAHDPLPTLPEAADPLALSRTVAEDYHNSQVARVNDHEIRMSVMHGQFRWHSHPESDETFVAIDGGLVIEFEAGEVVLYPGNASPCRAAFSTARGLSTSDRSISHSRRRAPRPSSRTDRAARSRSSRAGGADRIAGPRVHTLAIRHPLL